MPSNEPWSVEPTGILQYKTVTGRLVGSDFGSGASRDLTYYEAPPESGDDWLMLGHGVRESMVLVREGPLVRRVQHWIPCWSDLGSQRRKDYAVLIPGCEDPDFVACGVVFAFGGRPLEAPRASGRVGLVHRSAVEPLAPRELEDLWDDAGTRSKFEVVLKSIPEIGTAWPSLATLLGEPPPAHSLRLGSAQAAPAERGLGAGPVPVCIRNTFVDEPGAPGEAGSPRRRALSWSGEYLASHFAGAFVDTVDIGTLTVDSAATQQGEPRPVEPAAAPGAPPGGPPAPGSPRPAPAGPSPGCRRPCDVILLQLELVEVCRLGGACSSLRHWPWRFQEAAAAGPALACGGGPGAAPGAGPGGACSAGAEPAPGGAASRGPAAAGAAAARSRKVFPFRPQGLFLGRRHKAARGRGHPSQPAAA